MIEYLSIKGIYEKGAIRLLEKLTYNIDENAEVTVLIPVKHESEIKLPDFLKKINNYAIGGDAVADSNSIGTT
jgi:hypothetical protein